MYPATLQTGGFHPQSCLNYHPFLMFRPGSAVTFIAFLIYPRISALLESPCVEGCLELYCFHTWAVVSNFSFLFLSYPSINHSWLCCFAWICHSVCADHGFRYRSHATTTNPRLSVQEEKARGWHQSRLSSMSSNGGFSDSVKMETRRLADDKCWNCLTSHVESVTFSQWKIGFWFENPMPPSFYTVSWLIFYFLGDTPLKSRFARLWLGLYSKCDKPLPKLLCEFQSFLQFWLRVHP